MKERSESEIKMQIAVLKRKLTFGRIGVIAANNITKRIWQLKKQNNKGI